MKEYQLKYSNFAIAIALLLSAFIVLIYKYSTRHSNANQNLVDYYFLAFLLFFVAFLWLIFFTQSIFINHEGLKIFNPILNRLIFEEVKFDSIEYFYWYNGMKQSPTLTIVIKNNKKKIQIQVLSNTAKLKITRFLIEAGVKLVNEK